MAKRRSMNVGELAATLQANTWEPHTSQIGRPSPYNETPNNFAPGQYTRPPAPNTMGSSDMAGGPTSAR